MFIFHDDLEPQSHEVKDNVQQPWFHFHSADSSNLSHGSGSVLPVTGIIQQQTATNAYTD